VAGEVEVAKEPHRPLEPVGAAGSKEIRDEMAGGAAGLGLGLTGEAMEAWQTET
jgi:hypothetical protein